MACRARAPETLYPLLEHFVHLTDRWLRRNEKLPFREALVDLYFSVTGFLRVAELFNPAYTTCYEQAGKDLRVRLFCLDPSVNLEQALTRCRSAIFFSATMTPTDYFRADSRLPVGRGPRAAVPLCAVKISASFCPTGCRLSTGTGTKPPGTCWPPSAAWCCPNRATIWYFSLPMPTWSESARPFRRPARQWTPLCSAPEWGRAAREEFLSRFSEENSATLVGFAVMGGVFGEGIDLVGERLSGAAVVGVGLPGICPERELIRQYFADKQQAGFEFAYQFPGINRVLQAAGRVIRSESDRGVVLLVDRRFSTPRYRSLLPGHWRPVRVGSEETLRKALKGFLGD